MVWPGTAFDGVLSEPMVADAVASVKRPATAVAVMDLIDTILRIGLNFFVLCRRLRS